MLEPIRTRVALAPMVTDTGTTDTVTCALAAWGAVPHVSTYVILPSWLAVTV
jgi:hypothetical protein